ncbi:hypothetical protein C942_00925 [Photobacterium marinum]|uniref:Phage protein n=1 Tax=Photobacterium marinum TaxID=1056511 RepID=L8JC60_9GAMM|nr:hypothetical protein [Photobacterium marinum]ELR65838.1 hypothetical protein C942_00925 [Photobacterium marinum]
MKISYPIELCFSYNIPPPPVVPDIPSKDIQSITMVSVSETGTLPSVPSGQARANFIDGFWDSEFKDNIFIQPGMISLGYIATPSHHSIEIWSSYTKPLTLNQLKKIKDKGLLLKGQHPVSILAAYGGHWDYTLDVSLDVEMNVEAQFEWQFNHAAVKSTLNVLGSRVALWPYPPVYPVTESWQWFTAIIETRVGEQRLCNGSKPIQQLDYRYNLPLRVAAEQIKRYEAQGTNRHVVPVWIDATPPVTVTAGDKVIHTEVTGRDFKADGMVVVYKDANRYEVAFIDKVAESALVLKRPLMFDLAGAVVMPAIAAIAPDGLNSVRRGARIEQQICWVNSEPLSFDSSPQLQGLITQQYLGRPVIVKRGKSGGVRDDMAFTWYDKTTASGQQMMIAGRELGHHSTTIEWVADGRESCWQLRQFLLRFKGRLNTCWWVSFNNEICLAGKGSRKRILVKPAGFALSDGCHVYLRWRDGTQLVFAQSDGVDSSGNEILDIGGDGNIPVEPGDLLGGHVMRLMRPDDDRVKISYLPRHRMRAVMPMKEVSDGSY